jgi:hypothetical protein
VVDGFDGLRHDAIIGGDDENDDIGHRSAAGSHRGEGRVPRGVDDRDLLAMDVFLISADRLRDAAGFVGRDFAMANRIDDRGLAMVDVAHDGHDRRPLDEVFRIIFDLDFLEVLGIDDLSFLKS